MSFFTRWLFITISLGPALSFADTPKDSKTPVPSKDAKPAPPGEIAETVAAFKGNWTFDMKMTATGVPNLDKPIAAKTTFNCRVAAGGAAVACDAKTKTAMGPYEGNFFIAYDPYSKAVHFMGVTSKYEIQDHVCQLVHGMAGKFAIDCKPFKGGAGPAGEEVTNDLSISFHDQGKTADFKSVTHGKGGATMTFEGSGKK
jgi:hypothetical protein